jgi:trimethylamine--corrinoid protein Co-methyltransferase
MRSNYTANATPQFQVLSESQVEDLHLASLEVLRRTGVDVLEQQARELLLGAGAKVDGTRARIPPHLVEWAIRAAPPRIVLSDRNGSPAVYLEDNKGFFGTGSDTPYVIDPYSGVRRKAVKADVANVARVCDHLPNIDFVMCMGIASDVTESISDLHHFEAMVSNTNKPIVFTAWSLDNLKDLVEMAEAVAGGADALRFNPFVALYGEPISPLQLAKEGLEKLLYMAEKGLPQVWTPGINIGATAPVTLAGVLAQGNAEALAGLTIAQLKHEGAPVVYGGIGLFLDMRTTTLAYNAPEMYLSLAAWTDMAHHYRLPVWSYAMHSDSKVFDEQAALEGAMVTLIAALTGGNLIHDVGYIESGLTTSFEMLVLSDEIISLVKRFMSGVQINHETLALDVIDQIGPGGHYLGTDHTYRHFREHWYPALIDRGNYQSWAEKGEKTLGQRVRAKVKGILETYTPEPLAEDAKRELTRIIKRAERRARGQSEQV